MSGQTHDATFHVQLEPEWSHWTNNDGERVLWGAKAVGITQSRPRRPKAGVVIVKLTVRVPDGAFLPLRPEAIVVIPESMTETTPITVEASDPREGDEQ